MSDVWTCVAVGLTAAAYLIAAGLLFAAHRLAAGRVWWPAGLLALAAAPLWVAALGLFAAGLAATAVGQQVFSLAADLLDRFQLGDDRLLFPPAGVRR